MSKRVYWLWLAEKQELDAATIRRLTESFGTPEFLYASERDVLLSAGLTKRQTDALCEKDLSRAEHILRVCEQKKITLLTIEDSAYPDMLREIPDPPPVLYVRGTLPDFDQSPAISVVGTRSCSAYGLRMAERFGAALAKAGFSIVSGMAHGIDTAAHQGCLKAGGKTVAVLAGGVDICFPKENQYLMGDIMLCGAVISENPPGTANEGFRFPIRNRIITGMSAATLIVEAPVRSGAMISARLAFEQGREVFAIPGAVDVAGSVGCNRLIRDEIARIATQLMDIVQELASMLRQKPQEELVRSVWLRELGGYGSLPAPEPVKPYRIARSPGGHKAPQKENEQEEKAELLKEKKLPDTLHGTQRQIAEAICGGADTIDAISEATGLPAAEIASALVLLELAGIAAQKAGRCILLL